MLKKLRMWIDGLILSDHEWKKKYCPSMHKWLFEMTPAERSEACRRVDGTGNFIQFLKRCGYSNQAIIDYLSETREI